MVSTREALDKRELSEPIIEIILENKLTISKIEIMTIHQLGELFNELEVVEIWEKINIIKKESNKNDRDYRALKEFAREDGKTLEEKRDFSKSIVECTSRLKTLLGDQINILLFIGNGINEIRKYNKETESVEILDDSLSTKYLALNYVDDMGHSRPRDFQDKKDSLITVHQILSQKHDTYDMLKFMEHFANIDQLKEGFIEHIIKTCSRAQPNSNHQNLYMFLFLLHIINKDNNFVIFTTNYDNLLEKVHDYYNIRLRRGPRYWGHMPFEKSDRINYGETLSILENILQPTVKSKVSSPPIGKRLGRRYQRYNLPESLRPKYILLSNVDDYTFPIVPIHGSIRVGKCEICDRELETEATAIGKKCCVYCGNDISSIVLPTAEGDTDKEILKLLEEQIEIADIIIFVGYGLDDPHIRLKFSKGIENKDKIIINICNSKLKQEIIKNGNVEVFELNHIIDYAINGLNMNLIKKLELSQRALDKWFGFVLRYEQ